MRILFFSESAGVHERRFLTKLATTDHQIWFLPIFGAFQPNSLGDNITVLPAVHSREGLRCDFRFRAFHRLKDLLSQIGPDVVHAGPIPTCAFWAALAGAKALLSMSWGYDLLAPPWGPISSLKNSFVLRHSRAVICDCELAREEIARISSPHGCRTFVFPWGIELDRFHPHAPPYGLRSQMNWEGKHILLSTRSLRPLYGTKTMIRAALKAYRQNPNLRFVFAGSGPLRKWCDRVIRNNGAEGVFCFLGQVSEEKMPGLFSEANAYISASRVDGSSISLLQAFAAALPVVVTNIPANREWVVPFQNGWLAPVDNSDAFAEAIVQSAQIGKADLAEMESANLRIAVTRADWNTNFQSLLRAYEFVGK